MACKIIPTTQSGKRKIMLTMYGLARNSKPDNIPRTLWHETKVSNAIKIQSQY